MTIYLPGNFDKGYFPFTFWALALPIGTPKVADLSDVEVALTETPYPKREVCMFLSPLSKLVLNDYVHIVFLYKKIIIIESWFA